MARRSKPGSSAFFGLKACIHDREANLVVEVQYLSHRIAGGKLTRTLIREDSKSARAFRDPRLF